MIPDARPRGGAAAPVIFCPVPFYTLLGKTIPEFPRLKDKLFKVYLEGRGA